MSQPSVDELTQQLALADILLAGRATMHDPQDLPGRYGRVVRAIDKILVAIECEAVVGGGWAVWRHGFIGRVTQDIDIILPSSKVEEFLNVANVSEFEVLRGMASGWPKLNHKQTNIQVDVLPEGQRPGRPPEFAPTTISHPSELGASGHQLQYLNLASLVELKIAAGRIKDKADVVELIRANRKQTQAIQRYLSGINANYAREFEALAIEAQDSEEA